MEEEIKIGLESNVSSAATVIDGDLHPLFDQNTKRDDSLYVSQITPLEKIRQGAKDIRYIYTNVMIGDKVYFVLNPSPQNDNDGDGFPDLAPALMEEYKDPAPELIRALKEERSIVSEAYKDQWGTFISAYAPFYNSKGEFVGTLGMDLELRNFHNRRQPVEVAFEKTVIIVIFIGFVIGLLIWYIRRYSQILLAYKRKSQSKIDDSYAILESTYKENFSVLNKIKKGFTNSKLKQELLPENFYQWINHVLDYQKSKMYSERSEPEDFDLQEFIENIEIKSELQQMHISITNNVPFPFHALGAELSEYIDPIVTLLIFLKELSQSDTLQLIVSQKEEHVDAITLQLELLTDPLLEFESELLYKLHPDIQTSTGFNHEEFHLGIATQLLEKNRCEISSISDPNQSGISILMTLLKPKENECIRC